MPRTPRLLRPLALALAAVALAATPSQATAFTPPPQLAPSIGITAEGAREQCDGPAVVCTDTLAFGLSTPKVRDLGQPLTSLEKNLGATADLIGSFQDFTEPMYTTKLRAAAASGRTPMVTWEPVDSRYTSKDSYPLTKISAGTYDTYLRSAARQAKAVGAPFIIRFGHEMNGFWYPWGQPRALHPQNVATASNTPARYVAAYRHIVDVFRAEGATNVAWMWSPNLTDANTQLPLAKLYPGDSYVDVIGISGYYRSSNDTFTRRYRDTLDQIEALSRKQTPIVISETGIMRSTSRPDQMRELMTAAAGTPRVHGLVYFTQPDASMDFRIDTDTATQDVLRHALTGPAWTSPASDLNAIPRTPTVTGTARIGQDLAAHWSWRGRPDHATGQWLSCPAATSGRADCTVTARTSTLRVTSDLRGRYLRPALTTMSATTVADTLGDALGPVTAPTPAVTPTITMFDTQVRVTFPTAPAGVSHWLTTLNGGTPIYRTAATSEQWLQNLTPGGRYTVGLSVADGPARGPESTVGFTLLPTPPAPTLTTTGDTLRIDLPQAATGQSAWVLTIDGTPTRLTAGTRSHTVTGLPAGQHLITLAAASAQATTTTSKTTVTLP